MSMGNKLRAVSLWVFLGLLGAALFGPIGQWFAQVATDKGWYVGAGSRWDQVMSALFAFLASEWVRGAALLALGVVIGSRLDMWIRKREAKHGDLEEVRGRVFANEPVDLDGKRFVRCQFHSVRLRYSGGRFALEHNEFRPVPVIEPATPELAGYTTLLNEFGMLNMPVMGPDGIMTRTTKEVTHDEQPKRTI